MAAKSTNGRWRRRLTWPWRAPLALVLLLGITILVATTVYGANRHPVKAPQPTTTASTTPLSRPAATPAPGQPAPIQPALQEVIRQIQANPDLAVGVAIASLAQPQTRQQATFSAGTITGGAAWQTIDVAMGLAVLAQERQPEDPQYLLRRSLQENSIAGSDAIWAFLGEPELAAEKTTAQLRKYGDWKTDVPATGERGYPAYLTTQWQLTEQAQFMAALSCSYRQTYPVMTQLNQHDPSQSIGLARLPGAFVKSGQGLADSGSYVVRQYGLVQLRDGTEVAVALSVSSKSRDEQAIRVALNELAQVISTQVAGFQAPVCR